MDLNQDQLLQAYETMKTIREFEERVHVEFATGDMPGFVHLYAGEEASAAGVCMHLDDRDYIASTHRGHGHAIAKGVPIREVVAELFGKATGCSQGRGGLACKGSPSQSRAAACLAARRRPRNGRGSRASVGLDPATSGYSRLSLPHNSKLTSMDRHAQE